MVSVQSTHLSIGGPLLTLAPVLKIGLYGLHRGDAIDPETVVRRAQLAEQPHTLPADLNSEQLRLEVVVMSYLASGPR
jgi:hypothetical protein